jgi:CRP-like cAMP-binding protein
MIAELRRQTLFEDIPEGELRRLGPMLKQLSYKKGQQIFTEAQEARGIYLVRSGKVEISKLTADGWKQTLAVLGPGDFFGELSILQERRHEATATALQDVELYMLAKEEFQQLVKKDSPLAFHITRKIAIVMSQNLRRMNQKFLDALINY